MNIFPGGKSMLRNGLIQDMRRDARAEVCQNFVDPFTSVRTCEFEHLNGGGGSVAVELVKRVLDAGDHKELFSTLLANAGVLRDNYDLIVSLLGNMNSLVNKDTTITLLKSILDNFSKSSNK